jgi:hypothetical protein
VLPNIGNIAQVGTHDELIKITEGHYFHLVHAQQLIDENADDDDYQRESIADPMILSPSEKRSREDGQRPSTAKSGASSIRGWIRHHDLRLERLHHVFYLIYRMVILSKGHRLQYLVGIAGAVTLGMVYPVFSIIFGNIIHVSRIIVPRSLRPLTDCHFSSKVFGLTDEHELRSSNVSFELPGDNLLRITKAN